MSTDTTAELEQKRARLRNRIPSGAQQSPTLGIDHLAVFAKDLEATAEFYSQVIGMPVVRVTANRDVPESTHMNVDLGNGTMLSFFDFPHVRRLQRRSPEGVGGIMHIALAIAPEKLEEVKANLSRNRVKYQEIGGSIYFNDPNGIGLELMPR